MNRNTPFSRAILMTFALVAAACGPGQEASDADDADQSADATSAESALTTELTDEVVQPMSATAEDLATSSSTRVPKAFTPSSCVVATTAGVTVTYVMTDCTGPYGLVHVTGTVKAVYSHQAGGAVQAVIAGSGVKVNKATIDLNATVVSTQGGTTKTASVTSDATGTGPRGASIARKGAYVVTYDSTAECITVNGTWDTTAGLRKASTVVANYKRCKGICPASGGSIVHSITSVRADGAVTVSYDGSAVATWATTGGRTGTVNLSCSAN